MKMTAAQKRRELKYDRTAKKSAKQGNWAEATQALQTSLRARYRKEEFAARATA